MRHNVKGRKLNRTSSHRKALMSNISAQLFEHKQIITTLPKAKEARKFAEKMITLGKKGDLNSLRQALKFLKQKKTVFTLFNEIAPNYKKRQGGYTRVLKLGLRKGDAAETAVLQLVEYDGATEVPAKKKKIALEDNKSKGKKEKKSDNTSIANEEKKEIKSEELKNI
ncbi:MAG: 50S ribosomal protein L17 [Candidatus Delongbacteria bacterium]|nr:50S ribosomal protein L17 [Candidatus Delongbacteria bacterium]MCG2760446.1 50S ribosomal protein L17 [Candidatus Delongbacteria bacterium]